MGAEFFWVAVLVVILLAGPFATLRAVSAYRLRVSESVKKRQQEMEAKEKAEESSPDKPRGFW